MRGVSVIGIAQLPIKKNHDLSLRQLGAEVALEAMKNAGVDRVDALYVGNMLSDELQCQKHIAALIADEAGLYGVEAIQLRAAMASGAAAFRAAYLAVASGSADIVLAVGAERMSEGIATPALSKALDSRYEVPDGVTLISQNAMLMQAYFDRFAPPTESLAYFSSNAHKNAAHNEFALFKNRQYSPDDVLNSRLIAEPIRLLDCSPICDGAAAAVLAGDAVARSTNNHAVRVLASAGATDRFRVKDRPDPLSLCAAEISAHKAYDQAGLDSSHISFFEVHDAFSIMACLGLEASGFAQRGEGWRLAIEGEISLEGKIPLSTMGGLKARGHPIGATALYQVCEIVLQLTGRAGANQVPGASTGMMQSVGGAGTTILTHILGV